MRKIVSISRSLLAVFIGLLVISLIAESVEFGVVTALHGSPITDQEIYFEIRNQLPVILLKFIYNAFAAFIGGYLTGLIAGRQELGHGIALALTQAVSLIWGMTVSPLAHSTPLWAWIMLVLLMPTAIVAGARFRKNRKKASVILIE